ncbi:hypothetical protein BLNAU_2692 [Blattamonas nauphoetae]|uniref:Transmembrane protein n=1 Tax=Blattamonas nauphoetae TaxID=2049346 RepID=A0ABQ9YFU6_9EUKA|nr:hypothetical protein BLNAU_2692 [Blattamonas nauphoetae]
MSNKKECSPGGKAINYIESFALFKWQLYKRSRAQRIHPIFRLLFYLFLPLSFLFKFLSGIIFKTYCTKIEEQKPGEFLVSALGGYFLDLAFSFLLFHWILLFVKQHRMNLFKALATGLNILLCIIVPFIFVIVSWSLYNNNRVKSIEVHKAEGWYYVILNLLYAVFYLLAGLRILCTISALKGLSVHNNLKYKIIFQIIFCAVLFLLRAIQFLIIILPNTKATEEAQNTLRNVLGLVNALVGECLLGILMIFCLRYNSSSRNKKDDPRQSTLVNSTQSNGFEALDDPLVVNNVYTDTASIQSLNKAANAFNEAYFDDADVG